MRIRVPRRILMLGFVLSLLYALPAVTSSPTYAKPYNWDHDPSDPTEPGPTKGDGDGTIVKARYVGGSTTSSSSATQLSVAGSGTWSIWRTYLSLVRWGIGLRWGGF